MADVSELRKDLAELEVLHKTAQRPRVQDFLSLEMRRITTSIVNLDGGKATGEMKPVPVSTVPNTTRITKDLKQYAWDNSDKFMKVYLTLDRVHNIPKEQIKCSFQERSFKLEVNSLDESNYRLHVANLHEKILPDGSSFKVKTDMVVILLKKSEQGKTWPHLIQKDAKKQQKPPKSESSEGDMMGMMKQMYEDGDDDMKRTIAKAWTESQDKKEPGLMQ